MFTKTSAILKNKYFHTVQRGGGSNHYKKEQKHIPHKEVQSFFVYDTPVFLTSISGIAMIVVSTSPYDPSAQKQFILHGTIKIHSGVFFNYLSVSQSCDIQVSTHYQSHYQYVVLDHPIERDLMTESFHIPQIYTMYYQIKKAPYHFREEKHPYCELTIVESGKLETMVDGVEYTLKPHDVILYGSNQLHNQRVLSEGVTTYITIMFEMDNQDDLLFNRIFHLTSKQRTALEQFVYLSNRQGLPYRSDQLISQLKLFLLSLISHEEEIHQETLHTSMKERYDDELFQNISEYIRHYPQVQVADLVSLFATSRSSLQTLFHRFALVTPKQYIEQHRVKQAKILIQQSTHTLSEIARIVGYNSLPAFSRAFKQATGHSPTEFARSIYKKQ